MKNQWHGNEEDRPRGRVDVRHRDGRISEGIPAAQVDWAWDPRDSKNDVVGWEASA